MKLLDRKGQISSLFGCWNVDIYLFALALKHCALPACTSIKKLLA